MLMQHFIFCCEIIIKVSIQTRTGVALKYRFDVDPSTTIKQLKQLYVEKSNDNQDFRKMYFLFESFKLDDDEKTLEYYNIKDGSTLTLIEIEFVGRALDAGAVFTDLSQNIFKKQEWSTAAPSWRHAVRGLCLEGICTTKDCEAYNHHVIIPIGYDRFDILTDSNEDRTVCPVCKQYVEPETCAFNNCWWRYEGRKQSLEEKGKAPVKCSSDWKQVDNAYYYCDPLGSGKVRWKKLIIEAQENEPQT